MNKEQYNQWISVEDRLPELSGKVMGYWSHYGGIDLALYIKYENGGGRWGSNVGNITHWMPLPTPPTEGE